MTQKDKIIKLSKGGKTGYQIAKSLGVSDSYVYQVLKVAKLEGKLEKQAK